jgi:voltage-gated potassium channel
MRPKHAQRPDGGYREKIYDVVFEAEDRAGKAFDLVLLVMIAASVAVVAVESVAAARSRYGTVLYVLEWAFTLLFTAEYVVRLVSVRRPLRYAVSFFGIIDVLAILPTYVSLFVPGAQAFLVIRILRLLRVFRVLKMAEYLTEAGVLATALVASRRKIGIFLFTVLTLVVIIGATMYVVEGEAGGFTDIPTSMYWAIVTLTTVGYGDIAPVTPLGKMLAAVVMLMGYGIIAVPTGIVTAELARGASPALVLRGCRSCGLDAHDTDALHCKRCGGTLG